MSTIKPFTRGHLSSVLDNCIHQLQEKVNSEKQDYILNVNEAEYVEHLVSEFTVDVPKVDFDKVYADQTEKPIPANRHPSAAFFFDDDDNKSYTRQVIIYYLPVSGDINILDYMPNPSLLWSQELQHEVGQDGELLSFEIVNFGNDIEHVKRQADQIMNSLRTQLGHIQNQVAGYNSSLRQQVEQIVQTRKKDVLAKSSFLTGLGVPIRKKGNLSETFSVPTPKMPKKITPRPVATTGGPPEPTIDNQAYNDILEVIHELGKTIERMPSTYEGKSEEELRDHFLMYLEPRFEGSATGETFNKTGKTDILLRYQNNNVFIAECKFWSGEAKYLETIDQILRYLTWRDSKASVVLFVENVDFSSVIQSVREATPKHTNFLSSDGEQKEGTWQSYKVHLNGDKERQVYLTVLLFHYPPLKELSP